MPVVTVNDRAWCGFVSGTDILEGDPLGHLSVTAKGIIQRDHLVFNAARSKGIPILMVTSGGYQVSHNEVEQLMVVCI